MNANPIGAAPTPGSSCTQQPDGSSLPVAGPGEQAGQTSFSAAMANAAVASPATQVPNSEGSATVSAPAPQAVPGSRPGGAESNPSSAQPATKSTAVDGPPTGGPAAQQPRVPVGASVLATTKGGVPSSEDGMPSHTRAAQGSLAAQTNAKGEAPKNAGGATQSKASASPTADPSAGISAPNLAPATADATAALAAAALAAGAPAQAAAVSLGAQNARAVAAAGSENGTPVPDGTEREVTRTSGIFSAEAAAGASATNTEETNSGGPAQSALPSSVLPFAGALKAVGQIGRADNPSASASLAAPSSGVAASSAPPMLAGIAAVPTSGGAAPSVGPALVNIATPVGQAGFGQDVSRQLVYLAKTGTQSAELSLQPASLGPVSVSIQMNGLQASLVISASHAATRAALQDALPHLSELFQSSGLQLTGAQVGDGSERNADRDPGRRHGMSVNDPLASAGPTRPNSIVLAATLGSSEASNRLIDTFA